jgi:hypothetical protein
MNRDRCLLARVSLVAAIVLATLAPSLAAADNIKLGARIGYYTDIGDPFIGAELLAHLRHRIYFNPNFEWVFVDGARYFTLNGDFHYDFPTHSRTYVWAGAGLAIVSFNPDGPIEGNTDLGLNLLGGIGLRTHGAIPYFQAKVIAKDGSEFAIAFGVRF